MQLVQEAFKELNIPYQEATIKYSKRFNGYNANIRYKKSIYEFRLSEQWREVDKEIQKGVLQHLLRKIHDKQKTRSIQLYEEFLRQVADYAPRKESPQELVELFNQLNEEYFGGMMNQPNLEWGTRSLTQIGRYHYGTDTVRLSTVLKEDNDLLAFVLYHELLHKKHKFTCTDTHTKHHTKAFRKEEKQFRLADADKKLSAFIQAKRRQKRNPKKLSFLQKLFN